jgi:HEAT repeat protein
MGPHSDAPPIETSRMIVALHQGRVEVYSVGCPVDADGKTVHVVDNVSVDESLRALEGMVSDHRHGALAAIAMHDSPRASQVLERFATGSGGREVRGDALFWLAQVGGRHGFEVARRVANDDPEREVRKKAVFALTQSPEEPAVYDALVSLVRNHPDAQTREDAIFWLGQHEGQKALPVLRDIVEHDTDRRAREKAIFALSQVPGDEAVQTLIHLAREDRDSHVRKQALFWLGQKAETKISAIRESADRDPSSEVREMAVFAISQRPRDEAIPALIDLTHHKDPGVRKKAVFWLSQMDDPRALAAIEKLLLQ